MSFSPHCAAFLSYKEKRYKSSLGFYTWFTIAQLFQLAPNLFHFALDETPTSPFLRWVYTRCHFLTGFVALFYELRTWISQSLYIVGTDHHSLVIPLLSRDPEKRCYYLILWLLQSSWYPTQSTVPCVLIKAYL